MTEITQLFKNAQYTLQTVPVLYTSSIRGLATPWTYFLHLSLSSVILIDSSTESPVHITD